MVVLGIMNNFISLFKDTSLVSIVSMYELTGALACVNSDAGLAAYKLEGYPFIVAIYFAFCSSMSRYSLWIEKQLNKSKAQPGTTNMTTQAQDNIIVFDKVNKWYGNNFHVLRDINL